MRLVRHSIHGAGNNLTWRLIKWCFVYLGVSLSTGIKTAEAQTLGPFDRTELQPLSMPLGDQPFNAQEVLTGTFSTQESCSKIPEAVWTVVDGSGDCVRYYQHGLSARTNGKVLLYFSGDVLLRSMTGIRKLSSFYLKETPIKLGRDMAIWSRQAGIPAIFIARPGMYGSSGDHNERRLPREISLMNTAIDLIKKRYDIGSFIVVGQSGGGQIAAGLLNKRTDVEAAVISSGLLSVKQVTNYWENRRKIPGHLLYNTKGLYDPLDELDRIARKSSTQIYVISDPEDRMVPFYSQLHYVRRLRAVGLKPYHIFAHAPAPDHHLLSGHAKLAAALVARGKSSRQIALALANLDCRIICRDTPSSYPSHDRVSIDIGANSAMSAVVSTQDRTQDTILFEKNSDRLVPPASLTKIMTAIVALSIAKREKLGTDYRIIIGNEDLLKGTDLREGDVLSFDHAIANMLISSSNVTANAVARNLGALLSADKRQAKRGAVERFVDEMNNTANELGMVDSHFENPTGLSSQHQLTTAQDITKLMIAALHYREIKKAWGKKTFRLDISGDNPREINIENTNLVIKDYDVVGGKTGTLYPGVYNLAVISKSPNGDDIVSVVLQSPTANDRFSDIRRIIDAVKRDHDWSAMEKMPGQTEHSR